MVATTDTFLGLAAVITSIATLIGVVTTSILAVMNRRELRVVKGGLQNVRNGLETNNGLTVGEMVQHNYSMAAMDVPVADRTPEEHEAVAMLTDQERITHADRQRPAGGGR